MIEGRKNTKLTNSDQREPCWWVAQGQSVFIHSFYGFLLSGPWVAGIVWALSGHWRYTQEWVRQNPYCCGIYILVRETGSNEMNNNSSNKTHVRYLSSGLCCEAHSGIREGEKELGWCALQSRNTLVSWGRPPACVCPVILVHAQKWTWVL